MLDERKCRILQAIVDDYILTAMPVGSRTLSRKYIAGISSATIRNEMSDLEELGYLDQPHTSAGRIPSYLAYRMYVDQLMRGAPLSQEEISNLRGRFHVRMGQLEEVLRQATQVLSDTTQYASVVLAPQAKSLKLKRVQLVPITDTAALVVIVTDLGVVKDTIIPMPEGVNSEHLNLLSRLLTEQLQERTLQQFTSSFQQVLMRLTEGRAWFQEVLDTLERGIEHAKGSDIVVGGQMQLLQHPEYSDVDRARALLSILESKDRLADVLAQTGGVELSVAIGPEIGVPEMRDCSVVSMTYRVAGRDLGRFGVIGPVRMNYGRVIAVLSSMGSALDEILRDIMEES